MQAWLPILHRAPILRRWKCNFKMIFFDKNRFFSGAFFCVIKLLLNLLAKNMSTNVNSAISAVENESRLFYNTRFQKSIFDKPNV
jgi:hypothetical protein